MGQLPKFLIWYYGHFSSNAYPFADSDYHINITPLALVFEIWTEGKN